MSKRGQKRVKNVSKNGSDSGLRKGERNPLGGKNPPGERESERTPPPGGTKPPRPLTSAHPLTTMAIPGLNGVIHLVPSQFVRCNVLTLSQPCEYHT